MKRIVVLSSVALLGLAALVYGYRQMFQERAEEAQGEKPITAKSNVEQSPRGEAVVTLDDNTQKRIGLQTTLVSPTTLDSELKAYGHVLDSSPLVQQLSNIASTRASLSASSQEYQRAKALFEQGGNASARTLQTAEAAMKHDQITLRAAQAQLASAWGESIANRSDLPALVDSLSKLRVVLVRMDLPAGNFTAETPSAARLILPGADQFIGATFLDRATVTDPQVQGQGFVFLATNSPAWLSPGLALTGFLQMPGHAISGVIVPEVAVVRDAGKAWAYVQTDSTHFVRRPVDQDHPVSAGWFVTEGWQPQDRIVTTGAQTLLSEEHKSEIKAAD